MVALKILITDIARGKMEEQGLDPKRNILLLQYETDGCGCLVNGVIKLVEVKKDNLTDQEVLLDTEPAPLKVAIQKSVEWVYDDALKIDFSDTANMFQLKSPNQMLNPRMTFNALKN